MSYYEGYHKYVSVAEKKAKAQKSIEKLKKKNPDISPVSITGRKLAMTWWGQSWNKNLESYSDYSNRIERGQSYVRNGALLDLRISRGNINALVQGSRSKPYNVSIEIEALSRNVWNDIAQECAGKIDTLQELVEGKFPKALSDLFTAKGIGLFPSPDEIKFNCSCPDYAYMCKHVAAVLYGVGVRLDDNPVLFFELRDINIEELISKTLSKRTETLLKSSKTKSSRVLSEDDIGGLFGIDMETPDMVEQPPVKKTSRKKKA